MDDTSPTSRSRDSGVFSSAANNPNILPTLQQTNKQHNPRSPADLRIHTTERDMSSNHRDNKGNIISREDTCDRCEICKSCDKCKDDVDCNDCRDCANCSSDNPRNDNKCSPGCGLSCAVCGNRRCQCREFMNERENKNIVRFIGEYNAKKLPVRGLYIELARKRGLKHRILPRTRRCKRSWKPEPVRFIDLMEKERLTFIEYTRSKKQDLATKARCRSLGPDEKTRLMDIILGSLSQPKCLMSPPPTPSSPPPRGSIDRNPEDLNQGGAGFALAVPTLLNNFPITSYHAFTNNNHKNNTNTCASPSCRHTCIVCGHKRCHCPECGSLNSEIRIVSWTRRRRDPSMQWRKTLARPKCCKCLQQPKPVQFIDPIEKERLTFIEYAGFKKEDDTTPTRRSPPLSPEEDDPFEGIIVSLAPPTTPPPPPTPTIPANKNRRGPDQDGPGGGASAIQITAIRAPIPPSSRNQQIRSRTRSHPD